MRIKPIVAQSSEQTVKQSYITQLAGLIADLLNKIADMRDNERDIRTRKIILSQQMETVSTDTRSTKREHER